MGKKTVVIVSAFLAFWIFGFSDILKGSVLPAILDSGSLDYSMCGALLGFTYFGFFSGTLSSVFLLKRGFAPYLLFAAVLISTLGCYLFGIVNQAPLFFLAVWIIGVGSGLIDVTANLTVRMNSEAGRVGRNMNLLAFFHGAGAVLAPLFTLIVFQYREDWHSVYFSAALVISVFVIWIGFSIFFSYPLRDRAPEAEAGDGVSWNRSVLFLGILLFFYMTLEAGIGGWLVQYFAVLRERGEESGQFALSLFFILLTAGRLVSSLYVDRLGLELSLTLNILGVLVCAGLGVLFRNLVLLVPVSGFFMAPLFPSTVALISTVLHSGSLRILGLFFALGGLGGLAGPWLIGYGARHAGLDRAFGLLIPFAVCALISILLFKRLFHERISFPSAEI